MWVARGTSRVSKGVVDLKATLSPVYHEILAVPGEVVLLDFARVHRNKCKPSQLSDPQHDLQSE